MPASTATMPDAAKAFTMKSYSSIVRVAVCVVVVMGVCVAVRAVRMAVVVAMIVLVFVVVFFDFHVAGHHENAALHAHHLDRRAVEAREHGRGDHFVHAAERRHAVAQIQHAVERVEERIEFVRREQYGDAQFALHAPHEFDHAALMVRVEADERLVEQQQFRVAEQTLREQQALALAAREFRKRPVGELRRAHEIEHAGDVGARGGVGARQAPAVPVGGHRHEVAAAHAAARERRARLRHVADLRIAARDRFAEHADRAARGGHEAEDRAHQCGLARAVRSEHADEFALVHGEVGVAQDRAFAERERHAREREHRLRRAVVMHVLCVLRRGRGLCHCFCSLSTSCLVLRERLAERVELRQHPLLEIHARGLRLGHAHRRHLRLLREAEHAPRERLGRLAVVDQHVHAALAQIALEGGDVRRARLGVVHRGELEAQITHVETDRIRHIAEHRLGGRHRHALVLRAQRGDLHVDRLERAEERGQVRIVHALVRRVRRAERRAHRARHGGHGLRVVPEVRIVARFLADEVRRDDGRALAALGRAEQLAHPRVVVGAVVDHHARVLERARRLRARFEQVRVLIRIAQDARHAHVRAADLLDDVAIEVLRRHHGDGGVGLRRARRAEQARDGGEGGERQRGGGLREAAARAQLRAGNCEHGSILGREARPIKDGKHDRKGQMVKIREGEMI
ncbi:hypothetical protein PT2222_270105 [Paraburkholderia tropica]